MFVQTVKHLNGELSQGEVAIRLCMKTNKNVGLCGAWERDLNVPSSLLMLAGCILQALYQPFSRSAQRDVIAALSSVDTTAHSQQCIVPRSRGSLLFLHYWLYLKHFSHINNMTGRIR